MVQKGEKTDLLLSVIDAQQAFNPALAEESEPRGSDFVRWGEENRFPLYLLDTVNNCATLGSIINGSIEYTIGNGIVNNIRNPYFNPVNEYGESVEDVVSKVIMDRWIFGGFAVQVKYSRIGNNIVSISYIDFSRLRTDSLGEWVYVMDRKNLTYGTNRAKKMKAFCPDTGSADGVQIFYWKGFRTRGTYPKPDYYSALASAQIQIDIQKFHITELRNNFMPSAILKFKGQKPTKEIIDKIEKQIRDKFTGEGKQCRFMTHFSEGDGQDMTVEKLSGDDFDQRYQALAGSSRENLFGSLSASPVLFGMVVSTGFNEQEYEQAFRLYNRTKVAPKQQEITRAFNCVFGRQMIDGIEQDAIQFIPFSLNNDQDDE